MGWRGFFLLSLLVSGSAFAVDPQYVQLTPRTDLFEKKSEEIVSCADVYSCNQMELGMVIEEGVLKSAHFIDGRNGSFPRKQEFTVEDLQKLELYTDPSGRAWIKSMAVSKKLLAFIINAPCWYLMPGPQSIKTVETESQTFTFNTEGLGVEAVLTPSSCGNFTGKLKNKEETPYVMPLMFKQERWKGIVR